MLHNRRQASLAFAVLCMLLMSPIVMAQQYDPSLNWWSNEGAYKAAQIDARMKALGKQ